MRKITIVFGLLLTLAFSAVAQDASSEKRELMNKMFALYQKGELEAAAKIGEKLVRMEKNSKDSVSYVNALVNLARIKRDYFASLQNEIITGKVSGFRLKPTSDQANLNADEAEDLFREALEINEKNGREKTAQTAAVKKDLAWLMSNHIYSGQKTLEKSRSRIDEIEKLLLDAVATSEQASGADADETLFIVLDAGDFYYKHVNFEKSLPFYERFIKSYEKKHGVNHADLVNALRPYAAILFATYQDAEAAAVVKRIEEITKKSEAAPDGEIDLHLRSKDSVNSFAPVKLERRFITSGTASQLRPVTSIPVIVEVDETGKIIKATAKTDDDKLKKEAESAVAKWTVRPFSYNGTTRKMRGTLTYRKLR